MLAGCGTQDLFVVDVPDSGAFRPPQGRPCANTSECLGGQLCEKESCGAALGRCVARPPFCDGDARPECGCDGVTYWNDCLRRLSGVESREPGPCVNPLPCDLNTPCPGDAVCGRIVEPEDCDRLAAGTCHVLPQTCEAPLRDHFVRCGATQCIDACAAIRSGEPTMKLPGPCQ